MTEVILGVDCSLIFSGFWENMVAVGCLAESAFVGWWVAERDRDGL